MTSSLLSEDVSVEKGSMINDSILFTSNSSLSTTCDNHTLTRTRNVFASFLVSVQQSNPSYYWYNIYNNNYGSLFELLRVEECILSSSLKICGLIRYQLLRGNMTIYIVKDKWKSFLTEYQLSDLEIETSKLNTDSSKKKMSCLYNWKNISNF